MAKRTNQNQKKKQNDDSDNRTVIKISNQSNKKSQESNKDSGDTAKKETRSDSSRQTKSRSGNRKSNRKTTTQKTNPEPASKPSSKTPEQKPVSTISQPMNKPSAITPAQKPSAPVIPPTVEGVKISQSVAILIDGNNIEMSLTKLTNNKSAVLNFDKVIPKLLSGRGLNRLIYFREGRSISQKLADRLHTHYFGSVVPCHKSADIPLSIQATQLAEKVDTIIILSGDSDYVELVRHVKSKGVRVEIAAIEITTASILIEEADYYIPITEEDAFIVK